MKTIAERFIEEFQTVHEATYAAIRQWLEQQPENNLPKTYWVIPEGSNVPVRITLEDTFTLEQVEAVAREAWEAGQFAEAAYMPEKQKECLEAWINNKLKELQI